MYAKKLLVDARLGSKYGSGQKNFQFFNNIRYYFDATNNTEIQ